MRQKYRTFEVQARRVLSNKLRFIVTAALPHYNRKREGESFMDEITNKKILLVDDEQDLLRLIEDILRKDGFYRIFTASTCAQARAVFQKHAVQCCIFDVMLPDGDGFSLMESLRETSRVPVLFLTARGEAEDRLEGLGLGADDYIVKPFLPQELTLRLRAVLSRVYQPAVSSSPNFSLGDRRVDLESGLVETATGPLSLTAKEYILLKKLYENQNRIVTNDALCEAAWGDGYYGYENTLMVHIRRIRKKIEPCPSAPRYLLTVKGLGYKLVMDHD